MNMRKAILWCCGFLMLSIVGACPFDDTLRAYLSAHFWLPFAKHPASFEKPHVRRISAPYAGMVKAEGDTPLQKLRAAYQQIAQPEPISFDPGEQRRALAAARSDPSLGRREREEVDLIDAKIDMRAGLPDRPELLHSAEKKLQAFLRAARTPEFRSEARGWLAHVYYVLGDQTAAGKIYLDELNRNGSNLSRETLLNSLRITYGYDGGPELLAHLREYFDTPEHAAFAIQMTTNPRWENNASIEKFRRDEQPSPYARIKGLLEEHADLLRSNTGANALALLSMRTALRMGDPAAAGRIAEQIPAEAAIRREPDFNWMSGSAHFLAREYAAAEPPLLVLFRSRSASPNQKAAAAYALCGVYRKTGNAMEQLRYALWLSGGPRAEGAYFLYPGVQSDLSLYWAQSGWDLNMLLDAEIPTNVLRQFVEQNPALPNIRVVKYSLAVRLTRENRYAEAADIYQAIHANRRASRIRRLASLHEEANRVGADDRQRQEARFKLAEYISENPDRIYFNDALWHGFQRYALSAASDHGLSRAERQIQIDTERKLKDDQEERWRAYLILRDVVRDAGRTPLGRKAALLAIGCLNGISERFQRQPEIHAAQVELWKWLRTGRRQSARILPGTLLNSPLPGTNG